MGVELRLVQIGLEPAVRLAVKELERYLPKIDSSVDVAVLLEENAKQLQNGIRVGVSAQCAGQVDDPELDDAVYIDVENGRGTIAGSNARSVLIAAYRFLKEAGCRWVRPGKDGEKIFPRSLADLQVHVEEKAAYRHRGVCIEGACSYRHVLQMIEWLPKAGLNGYFHQFFVPHTFLNQWYSHRTNPTMEPLETSVEEIAAMVEATVPAIEERGLMFHRVGHGWTCEPFGIPGLGWDPQEYDLPEEEAAPFALVNGKRGIWMGIPLNTSLCYSNEAVRKQVAGAVVSYAKAHPQVDYLHFWLADEANNHCECEHCKDTRPSDFYVRLLNEIDEALTASELKTRVVFLNYMDLLWPPEREEIKREERFSMMFAPISRTYSNTFLDGFEAGKGQTTPYVRNRLKLPTKVEDNLAYLREWQKRFKGDSFIYDYHMLWDWNFDLGGYRSSEVLFEDMKDLKKLGLNGMMSCQVQRAAFPTTLGMVSMAEALWNPEQTFEEVAEQYFEEVFGENAGEMADYFKTLSEQFHPPYLRLEEEQINPERSKQYVALAEYVRGKQARFAKLAEQAAGDCDRMTWKYIRHHAEICLRMAETLAAKAAGKQEEALQLWEMVAEYANRMEPELHSVWDVSYFLNVAGAAVRNEKRPGLN